MYFVQVPYNLSVLKRCKLESRLRKFEVKWNFQISVKQSENNNDRNNDYDKIRKQYQSF